MHHHLLYHQSYSWKVHSFSHQEVPQTTYRWQSTEGISPHGAHSPPLEFSTMKIFSSTFMWCCHFASSLSLGQLTRQFCIEQCTAQVSMPWRSNSPPTKSCGHSHLLHHLGIVPCHLAQETSSRDPSVTMTAKKALFSVLVSRCWLTSFPGCSVCRQPLCPGKWSMHNCLTSQDHYHQLFLFADPLERG